MKAENPSLEKEMPQNLKKYNEKRDFEKTPEPRGLLGRESRALRFVIQKHDASHLHYDLRLEMEGVMKSWAVPKGPSLNPSDKRLAMQVEDHPISYNTFEGTIPQGQYGGGEVIVWDNGTYHSDKTTDPKESEKFFLAGLKQGRLTFTMQGKKLKGVFTLARFAGKEKEWILIKKADEYASKEDITIDNRSVISKRTLIGRKEDPAKYSELAPIESSSKKVKKTKQEKREKELEKISPMLATLVDEPFDDPDYIYEIKWDGYRAVANINNNKVDLYSRNQKDFGRKFESVIQELEKVDDTVILDGEIIAYDENGQPGFQSLQKSMETGARLEYIIFDILHLNGRDLRSERQIERKEVLKSFLEKYPFLTGSEYVEEKGIKFFNLVKKKNFEGIIAKRKDSVYIEGKRTLSWLKIKHHHSEEAVIVGFTKPRGSREKFGALVLGVYKNGRLVYAGHTGTGFDQKTLNDVYGKMTPLITKSSPFDTKVPVNSPITWVRPKLVAQLKFAEWTDSGVMRQAVFLGLREDKPAKNVVKEEEQPVEEVLHEEMKAELTNLDKIYFPKLKITKGDVVDYYRKISPILLPYLKDRPESLNRHPNGIAKPNFFQKNFATAPPSFAQTEKIFSESNNEYINYLVCQNQETLLYMANLGCIEINPWNSRIGQLDYPDYMIFDLDPKQSSWENLIKVAKELKKVLDASCQKSYLKTSGKSGLHICVPLHAKYNFLDVRNFCELISRVVVDRLPEITSLERNPAKRKKKIYLDYLQNRIGQTTACAYSLRPTENASVSTPLKWSELTIKLDPKKFNIKTIHARIKKVGDLWKPVITESVDLKKAIICLEKELKLRK